MWGIRGARHQATPPETGRLPTRPPATDPVNSRSFEAEWSEPLDLAGLRAALRLLFDGPTADRLCASAGSTPTSASLNGILQRASLRYTLACWRARLPGARRRDQSSPSTPLGPTTRLPARAALSLALQLGLSLSAERLASRFGTELETIGVDLAQARAHCEPCADAGALVGRYRDPGLDVTERLTLYRHAQECERCREALAAFEQFDARLLKRIAEERTALPGTLPRVSPVGRLLLSPVVVLLVAGLLLLGVAIGAGTAWSRIQAARSPVVALGSASDAATLPSGWLIWATSQQGVAALNPATGNQVTVAPGAKPGLYTSWDLSPNSKLLESWTIPEGGQGDSTVRITTLGGSLVRQWTWPFNQSGSNYYASGWLDDSTILIIEQPPFNDHPSTEQSAAQTTAPSKLLALDIRSGSQRTLIQEVGISGVAASPDRRLFAIERGGTSQFGGATLELRASGPDGLGPPIASVVDHLDTNGLTGNGGLIWAPDSSRLYFSLLSSADETATPAAPGQNDFTTLPQPTADLAAMDRSGRITTVLAGAPHRVAQPIALTADGGRLIYQLGTPGLDGQYVWQTWEADSGGGNAVKLNLSGTVIDLGTTATPRGEAALLLGEATSNLRPDPVAGSISPFTLPLLALLAPDGSLRPLLRLPALDSSSYGLMRWLPPEEITPPTTATPARSGEPSTPAQVPDLHVKPKLDAGGSVSDDGQYVVMTEQALGVAMIWSRTDDSARRLGSGVHDLSWWPGQDVLIGVTDADVNMGNTASRLALFAAHTNVGSSIPSYDFQQFDPAGLGSDTSRRYARPMVAPGGLATSFFVIDERSGTAQLWLANWGHQARPVTRFQIHSAALGDAPLIACWVDADTLVFIEPGDWRAGPPRAATLMRLTINPDGTTSITALTTERIQGSDRGLIVTDLALSPGGSRISERLRHFTHGDARSGLYDTLVVAPAGDLGRRFEIARGLPGDGLSWAPDSSRIAFGLDGRLTIASADGRSLTSVDTPNARAGYPLWVGPDQLWFSESDPNGSRVMQVQVR